MYMQKLILSDVLNSICICVRVYVYTLMVGCLGVFFFFWAAPMAYGGSQPRGPIGATAAGLHHSSVAMPDP